MHTLEYTRELVNMFGIEDTRRNPRANIQTYRFVLRPRELGAHSLSARLEAS